MDCLALPIPQGREGCDYIFVGEEDDTTWVVPIELKSGGIGNVNHVLRQLEGGAMTADAWLPEGGEFELLPVVAHGKADWAEVTEQASQLQGLVAWQGEGAGDHMRCG